MGSATNWQVCNSTLTNRGNLSFWAPATTLFNLFLQFDLISPHPKGALANKNSF